MNKATSGGIAAAARLGWLAAALGAQMLWQHSGATAGAQMHAESSSKG
jgi:hypothetical protein